MRSGTMRPKRLRYISKPLTDFSTARPLDVVVGRAHVGHRGQQDEILDVQDAGGLVGAFERVPRRMKCQASLWLMVTSLTPWNRWQAMRTWRQNSGSRSSALAALAGHQQVQAVDLLPHFRGDGLAHRAGVLARRQHAGADGVGILRDRKPGTDHVALRGLAVSSPGTPARSPVVSTMGGHCSAIRPADRASGCWFTPMKRATFSARSM